MMKAKTALNQRPSSLLPRRLLSLLLPMTLAGQAAESAASPIAGEKKPSPWDWNASLGFNETYDSNVFLQDVTNLADQDSFVTTGVLDLGATYRPSDALNVSLKYNLNANWYHSESSENHFTQKINLDLNGKLANDKTTWNWKSGLTQINGDDLGLIFTGVGGAPAGGGIPIRNRRDAAVWLSKVVIQHPLSDLWFVRPLFSLYIHDFQTIQYNTTQVPGYLNYVDRNDFHGGFDFGYTFAEDTALILGYRIGHQDQSTAANYTLAYSNYFQRFLVGLESKPANWLTLNLIGGPDFRAFPDTVAAGFNENMTVVYYDLNATMKVSPNDTVALSGRQYMQPGFGGQSIYEDILYTASWNHRFGDAWNSQVRFNAYSTAFLPPVARDDWIYTPSAQLSYAFAKNFTATAAYSYDWSESRIPNTPAREFTRHLGSLGLAYKF